jgi:hypothetical protein
MEKYTIAICTQGINPNIQNLLARLLDIKSASSQNLQILIVLNSKTMNLEVVTDVHVVLETEPGYSRVRNKAVSQLRESSNLIFIDDDEIPTLDWFQALVGMHQKFPSDIIVGPVFPDENSHKSNISYRRQFTRSYESRKDESLVQQGPTANMLIPLRVIREQNVYFDLHFNFSGSEDTDFCFRMRKKGVKIRFAKFAAIFEQEKSERFEKEYLEQRKLRDVSNYSVVIKRNSSSMLVFYRFCTLSVRILFLELKNLCFKGDDTLLKIYKSSLGCLISGNVIEN